MSSLNNAQLNALNSMSPAAVAAGVNLGDLLDQILDNIASGSLGIEADAWDVDSIAQHGGNFSRDVDNDSGLTFGFFGGRIYVEGTGFVTVAQGTVALSASTTNYVEVSAAGAVSKNTVGFTEGRVPLYTV